jgi:hypothetical protein
MLDDDFRSAQCTSNWAKSVVVIGRSLMNANALTFVSTESRCEPTCTCQYLSGVQSSIGDAHTVHLRYLGLRCSLIRYGVRVGEPDDAMTPQHIRTLQLVLSQIICVLVSLPP